MHSPDHPLLLLRSYLSMLAVDLRPYYVAMPFVRAESAQNSTVPADVARNRRHYVCDVCGLD